MKVLLSEHTMVISGSVFILGTYVMKYLEIMMSLALK